MRETVGDRASTIRDREARLKRRAERGALAALDRVHRRILPSQPPAEASHELCSASDVGRRGPRSPVS
jgi:hypothetical protein